MAEATTAAANSNVILGGWQEINIDNQGLQHVLTLVKPEILERLKAKENEFKLESAMEQVQNT